MQVPRSSFLPHLTSCCSASTLFGKCLDKVVIVSYTKMFDVVHLYAKCVLHWFMFSGDHT